MLLFDENELGAVVVILEKEEEHIVKIFEEKINHKMPRNGFVSKKLFIMFA